MAIFTSYVKLPEGKWDAHPVCQTMPKLVRSRVASCCPHFSSRIAKANKEIDTTRAQTMQTM
jgi:hypothetical protein